MCLSLPAHQRPDVFLAREMTGYRITVILWLCCSIAAALANWLEKKDTRYVCPLGTCSACVLFCMIL
jgi:hypothetical protein